ncbi:MAG TPA: aldehyde dehydrogenase family protein [Syntrophales bacterium]|nr:aldehyde dehydrogenase family protein [Syntrophales bacterium]
MEQYRMYIDGQFVDAESGETRASMNPATEEPVALAPVGTRGDMKRAIEAARRAFDSGVWSGMPVGERAQLIYKLVEKINDMDMTRKLGTIETQDAGFTISLSTGGEVPFTAYWMEKAARTAECLSSYEPLPWHDFPDVSWSFVNREPIGVCGGIIPWNHPFMMAGWKLGPALVMGCTVVLKPASETPLAALELAKLIDECGFPPGVVNIVTGPGSSLGEELCTHPFVDKVALTGSTEVGRQVMKMASSTLKKVTLELGGKSAQIIMPDADLEVAVEGSLSGVFYHTGQVCVSGTRIFVHEDIYDEYLESAIAATQTVRIGDPMDFETTMGPLISRGQQETVLRYIEIGKKEGATVATGGKKPDHLKKGFFVEPTIFTNVHNGMTIAQEEIFGPVVCIIKFRTVDEAVAMANDSIYGLGGAVWSRNIPEAIEIAKRVRTGTMWINTYHQLSPMAPFGGYKQSGIGREHGVQGLLEFTQAKHILVDLGTPLANRLLHTYVFSK